MNPLRGILLFILMLYPVLVCAQPVAISELPATPLTREWMQLKEHQTTLTPSQALQALYDGKFSPHGKGIPSLGIGTSPVWLALEINNARQTSVKRTFQLANAWQDDVSLTHIRPDASQQHWQGGDLYTADNRFLTVPLIFEPGKHILLLRVSGPDPRLIPVYLTNARDTQARDRMEGYSYGFLYGGIFALLGYNFLLYMGLNSRSYLYYSLFLFTFLLLNLSYTGHGNLWLWPDIDHWRQWSNPQLMTLYCVTGLMFALRFLGIDKIRPNITRIVLALALVMMLLQCLSFMINDRELALILAFDLVYLFILLMPILGVMAWLSGVPTARLFLLAFLSTMVGSGTTGMAVEGILPLNQWTFRAAEIGMFIDAVLLALALADKFRHAEKERMLAQQLAATDPLTGIDNRRAFTQRLQSNWDLETEQRTQALIMLDIDKFKTINDTLGHEAGDKVLKEIARTVQYSIRSRDHCGRWGGEEFVVYLPNATEDEIHKIAERLRSGIEALRFPEISPTLRVSASVGVCQVRGLSQYEDILKHADNAMYGAKNAGGNRIVFA